MARFGPVLTAMVTPFDAHGRLDLDGAAALAEWLVGHGSDGLVVTGSTGEAATLTDDERNGLRQSGYDAAAEFLKTHKTYLNHAGVQAAGPGAMT